jgi:hypothetical protein
MGLMPPYDPFEDPALSWAIARVESVSPASPTWKHPATVVLAIEEVLRGTVPSHITVPFGPPREAGQEHFYMTRALGMPPWSQEQEAERARQQADLDARPIEVPVVGERIAVWLAMGPAGGWDIPTLRTIGAATPMPMRSRWIDGAHVDAVRARLRT